MNKSTLINVLFDLIFQLWGLRNGHQKRKKNRIIIQELKSNQPLCFRIIFPKCQTRFNFKVFLIHKVATDSLFLMGI